MYLIIYLSPPPTHTHTVHTHKESEVSKKWSHCETVTLWNSLVTWKLGTSSIPLRCHWKPNCQVCHLWLFCWSQYSWFGRIPSAVANRYRKSASVLKQGVSITSISQPIKLVNIALQSVSWIHAEWAILRDDVGAASCRLIFLLKYCDRP